MISSDSRLGWFTTALCHGLPVLLSVVLAGCTGVSSPGRVAGVWQDPGGKFALETTELPYGTQIFSDHGSRGTVVRVREADGVLTEVHCEQAGALSGEASSGKILKAALDQFAARHARVESRHGSTRKALRPGGPRPVTLQGKGISVADGVPISFAALGWMERGHMVLFYREEHNSREGRRAGEAPEVPGHLEIFARRFRWMTEVQP
jgi:hypothetical protein